MYQVFEKPNGKFFYGYIVDSTIHTYGKEYDSSKEAQNMADDMNWWAENC